MEEMATEMMVTKTDPHRRSFTIRIHPSKLEGGPFTGSERSGTTIVVETRLRFRKKQSLLSPRKVLRQPTTTTSIGVVRENGGAVTWGEYDGFLKISCSADCEFDLSFVVLRKVERKDEEMGRVGMKSEELGKRKEMEVEKMLPIKLKSGSGAVSHAMLTVVISIAAEEGGGGVANGDTGEASKVGFFKRMMSNGSKKKKLMKMMSFGGVVGSSPEADELTRSASLPTAETQSPGRRLAFWKWKRLFFSGSRRKVEPFMKKMDGGDETADEATANSDENVTWEEKKIVSRDGEAEVKCSVALATFDQRSKEVAGEGACSAIAVEVAHWLHMYEDRVPNRRELDRLMVAGAAEWKKLGENAANLVQFPDKHFDMETVLRTGTIPLGIVQESSVVGFFSPEKFELLNGVLCVDGIWKLIQSKCGVYIVSWNDHFCVLKVDEDACYLIDSLGVRLEEGCKQAFILKFDESSVMTYNSSQLSPDAVSKKTQDTATSGVVEAKKAQVATTSSVVDAKNAQDATTSVVAVVVEAKKTHDATTSSVVETEIEADAGVIEPIAGVEIQDEREENLIICRGRECCKEFFKLFLAAIPAMNPDSSDLHRRLQIEFQYTTFVLK